VDVSFFLDLERLAAPGGIEYLSAAPSNKKPPAMMSRGAVISLIQEANCPRDRIYQSVFERSGYRFAL